MLLTVYWLSQNHCQMMLSKNRENSFKKYPTDIVKSMVTAALTEDTYHKVMDK